MNEITRLLDDYANGNRAVLDELLPLVYGELRRLAHSYLARERDGMTLQTTALVHEAYLKLIDQHSVDFKNRGQFFALSAQAMRRIRLPHSMRPFSPTGLCWMSRPALRWSSLARKYASIFPVRRNSERRSAN